MSFLVGSSNKEVVTFFRGINGEHYSYYKKPQAKINNYKTERNFSPSLLSSLPKKEGGVLFCLPFNKLFSLTKEEFLEEGDAGRKAEEAVGDAAGMGKDGAEGVGCL